MQDLRFSQHTAENSSRLGYDAVYMCGSQHFKGSWCLHLQVETVCNLKGILILQNVSTQSPNDNNVIQQKTQILL